MLIQRADVVPRHAPQLGLNREAIFVKSKIYHVSYALAYYPMTTPIPDRKFQSPNSGRLNQEEMVTYLYAVDVNFLLNYLSPFLFMLKVQP